MILARCSAAVFGTSSTPTCNRPAEVPRISNHARRHTGATLAYRYTHDLRAVRDMLGHQDPKTTARYARVVDRARTNPALKVPVDL